MKRINYSDLPNLFINKDLKNVNCGDRIIVTQKDISNTNVFYSSGIDFSKYFRENFKKRAEELNADIVTKQNIDESYEIWFKAKKQLKQ